MATYGQFIVFDFTTTYPGATVTHYAAGTTTLQNVWTDRGKTTAAAQPVVSDSNGVVSFYGDGIYKFVVKDTAGSTLYTWDNVNLVDLPLAGKGASLTSAGTVTFGTDGDYFHITGSAGPITNFSGTQGQVTVVFDSTPTLTHSAQIILRGSVNYVVIANDVFGFANEGNGVWREIFRSPTALALTLTGGTMTGNISMSAASFIESEDTVVTAAASTNIWTSGGNTVHVAGNTGITDFGTAPQAGAWKKVIFDGIPQLTQSANLNLNAGGENVTMAANDLALVYADTTTQMDVFIIRKSGLALVAGATASSYISVYAYPTRP